MPHKYKKQNKNVSAEARQALWFELWRDLHYFYCDKLQVFRC